MRYRSYRANLDETRTTAQLGDELDPLARIRNRRGIGHRVNGGEPARCCRARTGEDCFRRLAARFAQMSVEVNKAGKSNEPSTVDNPVGLHFHRTHLADHAIVNKDVGCTRAQQRGTTNHERHREPPITV